jgi:RNA polymerase sigma-70 factor (ECF subfamily)
MGPATDADDRCDAALVEAVRAGDRAAEFELDRRWRPRLVELARGIVHDDDLAQEVAQLALWRAFLNLERYDGKRPFAPWIRTIGCNCVWDVLRGQKADLVKRGGERLAHACAAAASPAEAAVRQEEREALQVCLEGLTDRSRTLVALFASDFSLNEMSQALRVPKSTVQGWLHTAFAQLRRCMSDKGFP